jgi:hypothetical protein
MHAVRLGFLNWGVRKVSGLNGEDAQPFHRERNPAGAEKRSPPGRLTVSRTILMHPRAGREGEQVQRVSKTCSKFEPETLAVAHHPAAAGASEMPADHEHRRSGKAPQERPAGAIRLRGIEIRGC